jgi:hypothetical protein
MSLKLVHKCGYYDKNFIRVSSVKYYCHYANFHNSQLFSRFTKTQQLISSHLQSGHFTPHHQKRTSLRRTNFVFVLSCSSKWPHYTVPKNLGNYNNIGLLSEQQTLWKLPIFPKYFSMMCPIKNSSFYKYLGT